MQSIPEVTQENVLSPKFYSSPSIKFSQSNLNDSDLGFRNQNLNSSFVMNSSFDAGRESLGILHLSTLRRESLFGGRESLGFGRESLSMGRESLGILNITELGRESIMSRPSISLLPPINISDCGKESLGILNLDDETVNDQFNISTLLQLTSDKSDAKLPIMETGFLLPPSRRTSILSSVSSINSNPSFNLNSFDGLSQIYSVSQTPHSGPNKFNAAFINSNDFMDKLQKTDTNSNNTNEECRQRLHSLPVNLPKNNDSPDRDPQTERKLLTRRFFSCGRVKKVKSIKNASFHGALNFDDEDEEEDVNDSVFVMARRLSQRFADGSIYDTSSSEDDMMLDSTAPPVWPDIDEIEEPPAEKCDTETVFKIIDRVIPETQPVPKVEVENLDTSPPVNNKSDQEHDPSKSQNFSNSSHSSHLSKSRRSNNSIKSREAKEIIHNLSEILANDDRSDSLKEKGHNLLTSLAGMICNNSMDDSSNLSNSDLQDSKPKSLSETDSKLANADNKLNQEPKRLSQSFSTSSTPKIMTPTRGKENKPKQNKSTNSTSVCSNDGSKILKQICVNPVKEKLKPKSIDKPATKKGPLKATIPITNMAKKPTFTTPTKTMQKIPSTMQCTRTSTPIQDSKHRPMAQSTPSEKPTISKLPKIVSSPVQRDIKFTSNLTNTSGSKLHFPNMDHPYRKLERRGSVSEIRRVAGDHRTTLKRSNSVGKDSGIMSALHQVRQNIVTKLTENNNSLKLSDYNPMGDLKNCPRKLNLTPKAK